MIYLVILMVASLTLLIMARAEMKRVTEKAVHDTYWMMCLGGRQFAAERRIESLNNYEEAEQAYREDRSFENMKRLNAAKHWHEDVVMVAYEMAVEMLNQVEEDQKKHLGKVS